MDEGDVTEVDEDDEDGLCFATLQSRFENMERVFNWLIINLSFLQCKKMVKLLFALPEFLT